MRAIKLTITIIFLIFLLGGCGSGEDAGFNIDSSSSSSSKTTVNISNCSSGNTSIQDGDTLMSDDSSSVNITHQSDGTKQICVSSGSAYLLR